MLINEVFANYFVAKGLVSKDDADQIIEANKLSKDPFYVLLVKNELTSETKVYNALSDLFNIPFASDVNFNILNFELIDKVPTIYIKENRIVPIGFDENDDLIVLIDSPFVINDVNTLRFYIDSPTVIKFITSGTMDNLINNITNKSRRQQAISELAKEVGTTKSEKYTLNELIDAPAVQLADSILQEAVAQGASDIHVEPEAKRVRVRYRVDGVLKEHVDIPTDLYSAVLARYKIMANLDISERRIPQDGKINNTINGKQYDFRVSTLPTIYGEKIVIRIFNNSQEAVKFNTLANNKEDLKKMERMIRAPHGIILLTGPTGSGKTTTLYSFLRELNKEGVNITTIEDPVENNIDGINQTQVNPKADLTFSSALRSILRQDPNIIMIGEIRDNETADIAVKAAITGHLVLSTVHTNDAVSTVTRLLDMGIENYLVADSLVGAISERLVRKLCPHCKEEHKVNAQEAKILGCKEGDIIYDPKGCPSCNYTGYKGRTGVFEILELDDEIRSLIDSKDFSIEKLRRTCLEHGYVTMDKATASLVKEGITSLDEYAKLITNIPQNLLDEEKKVESKLLGK
jgi:type IV pilus assembly protein PilB